MEQTRFLSRSRLPSPGLARCNKPDALPGVPGRRRHPERNSALRTVWRRSIGDLRSRSSGIAQCDSARAHGMISLVVVALRPAGPVDAAFLTEMLVAAAFWRPDGPTGTVDEVMAEPQFAHYIAGWPRPGDSGVIAEEDGRPVGAAWLRFFPDSDPGFGFVDAATPELSIGLMQQWRGQGIGTRLLDALLAQARGDGVTMVSLSVEKNNAAGRLYERAGFQTVGAVGGSVTLLLQL